MDLPHTSQARVEHTKLIGYLLSPTHPDGRSKAALFAQFGFTPNDWEVLQDALRRHGLVNPVVLEVESAYGVRYVVEGPLETPRGGRFLVRTVWIVEQGTVAPRLVTAYPVRRQDVQRA